MSLSKKTIKVTRGFKHCSLRTTCLGVPVSLLRDRPPRPQCGLFDSHNGWTTPQGSRQDQLP